MTVTDNDLSRLKQSLERALGFPLQSPTAFNALSEQIETRLHEHLSVSTLKRLWEYVPNRFAPRRYTLDILSKFLGYSSWEQFVGQSAGSSQSPSDPVLSRRINVAADLNSGDVLRLVWSPGRECVVRYLGSLLFEVERSVATRLVAGTTFSCGLIIGGEPLYIDSVRLPGQPEMNAYVCGQVGGVRFELLSPEEDRD